jgi:hypothetical protein
MMEDNNFSLRSGISQDIVTLLFIIRSRQENIRGKDCRGRRKLPLFVQT